MFQQFRDVINPERDLISQLRRSDLSISNAAGIREHLTRELAPHTFTLTGIQSDTVNFWHRSLDLGGIGVHYIDYECYADHALVLVDQPQDGIMIKFPLSEPTLVSVNDGEFCVHPSEFAVVGIGERFSTRMAGRSRHLTVTIDGDWLARYFASRDLPILGRNLDFPAIAHSLERDGLILSGVLSTLMGGLSRGDKTLAAQGVSTHLKELIAAVVLTLSPVYRRVELAQTLPDTVPDYVHRAEQFMLAHLEESIDINDIVRAAGATRRTLHSGIRKHRGTTPMMMLKTMRLKAAKSALEDPAMAEQSVTTIATTYGFYHLGRFSQDFKDTFGVLPSQVSRNWRHANAI